MLLFPINQPEDTRRERKSFFGINISIRKENRSLETSQDQILRLHGVQFQFNLDVMYSTM